MMQDTVHLVVYLKPLFNSHQSYSVKLWTELSKSCLQVQFCHLASSPLTFCVIFFCLLKKHQHMILFKWQWRACSQLCGCQGDLTNLWHLSTNCCSSFINSYAVSGVLFWTCQTHLNLLASVICLQLESPSGTPTIQLHIKSEPDI